LQTIIGVANPVACGAIRANKIFVYCNICESYIIDDVRTPLFRVMIDICSHNYAFGANLMKHFSFPNYISLRQTNFRTIEIDIRDHILEKKFHSNLERCFKRKQ